MPFCLPYFVFLFISFKANLLAMARTRHEFREFSFTGYKCSARLNLPLKKALSLIPPTFCAYFRTQHYKSIILCEWISNHRQTNIHTHTSTSAHYNRPSQVWLKFDFCSNQPQPHQGIPFDLHEHTRCKLAISSANLLRLYGFSFKPYHTIVERSCHIHILFISCQLPNNHAR